MVICSNITLARLGDGLLVSNGVSMFSNNLLDLGLVCPLSDNSVVSLINNIRGAGNWSPNKSSISNTNIADSKARGINKGASRAGFSFIAATILSMHARTRNLSIALSQVGLH